MIKTSIGEFTRREFIKKCNDKSFSEYLVVEEDYLDFRDVESLINLPRYLRVEGSLDLWGCSSLTALPECLSVRGHLYLQGCRSLTALPEGLSVGINLYLNGCTSLTTLPSDLKVGHNISADESFIRYYPFRQIPKILHLPFREIIKTLIQERLSHGT